MHRKPHFIWVNRRHNVASQVNVGNRVEGDFWASNKLYASLCTYKSHCRVCYIWLCFVW